MPVTAIIDPAQALWDDYQAKVATWERLGAPSEGESVDAMEDAEERFIEHRTRTPLGIRLKLEHVAETDNMANDLSKNPTLTVNRIVMGLLRDLKSASSPRTTAPTP